MHPGFFQSNKNKASVSTCRTKQIQHGVHEAQKVDTGLTVINF